MPNDKQYENNEALELEYVAEEDDITEYIQNKSFSDLVARFGTAEEDESIRNEDFNPLVSGRIPKKANSSDMPDAPALKKDMIHDGAESQIPLRDEFGLADSVFDNDAISFDDIDIGDFEVIESELDKSENKPANGFNTNTRVVYLDKSVDDGIKRNSDEDVSSVFTPNE
ncbi:MAG: hypothetical protein ACI4IM_07190 [Acutalibacteraceae bacterium]